MKWKIITLSLILLNVKAYSFSDGDNNVCPPISSRSSDPFVNAYEHDSSYNDKRSFLKVEIIDAADFPKSIQEMNDFFGNGNLPSKPLLFKGAALNWPIMSLTFKRLKSDFGDQVISFISNYNTGEVFSKEQECLMKDYIDDIKTGVPNYRKYLISAASNGTTTDSKEEGDDFKKQSFLAANPHLLEEVQFSSIVGSENRKTFVLFIGGSSKTIFHQDYDPGFFLQIYGSKNFYLVDPIYIGYICSEDNEYRFNSFIDPEVSISEMENICPSFNRVPTYHVTVNKGDILYLPKEWVHRVTSEGLAISMTAFLVNS